MAQGQPQVAGHLMQAAPAEVTIKRLDRVEHLDQIGGLSAAGADRRADGSLQRRVARLELQRVVMSACRRRPASG